MPNSISLAPQISLFRSRIRNRSFEDVTVRVLDSILVAKDVQSLIGVRSALKEFMRDESALIFREIMEESVEIKLLCADFLITVFAIIGDIESCMALRYEALIMREQRMASNPDLQVSCDEWLTFAEHSLENGFHSIAHLACEKARLMSTKARLMSTKARLMSTKAKNEARHEMGDGSHDLYTAKKMKRLNDAALLIDSSRSVRAQTAVYLNRKNAEQITEQSLPCTSVQTTGSYLFRSGIRKHNLRKFHQYRCRTESS